MNNIGIHDDPDRNPAHLRFSPGNLVMYKRENGWFEGEVVKVNQRLTSGSHQQYIPYIVWPQLEDVDGTEWVEEDTDEFIKPRMVDKSPDPSKFKPLLVVPHDPYHFLYDGTEICDSKDGDGVEMENQFKGLDFVAHVKTNPDGTVRVKTKDGGVFSHSVTEIPTEPICGVEPFIAITYATNQLSIRKRVDIHTYSSNHGILELFKELDPKESLSRLEISAKSSDKKMLQLADCLMTGVNGFPRDSYRACNLFRAAAWGCTEEQEETRSGIPNGEPEAMIAVASLCMNMLKSFLGYEHHEHCPEKEWLEEGFKSSQNRGILHQTLFWLTTALAQGHVTSLILMVAAGLEEMDFINDRRATESEEDLLSMCQQLLQAKEYRAKEIEYEKMQEEGFPRGEPHNTVLEMFKPHALDILQSLPIADDKLGSVIHIEFKQVPRPPFPMVVISIIPFKKKIQTIVKLPKNMQMTPFSLESFQYVWARIAFDIHLGRLGTGLRVRPKSFTVPDTHGNKAFASFLEGVLENSDITIKMVSHSHSIKLPRSRTTVGQLVTQILDRFIDMPDVLVESGSENGDIVARAQEDFFDRMVSQEIGVDEDDDDAHLQHAQQLKQRGNEYFQVSNINAAVKCYSIAMGHMRRVVDHSEASHKLLGTLLSNRAACFINLIEAGDLSVEFRTILAKNAINDCSDALVTSWASTFLSSSILDKLKFRRDKATASYDALVNSSDLYPVREILFPTAITDVASARSSSVDSSPDPTAAISLASTNDNTQMPSSTPVRKKSNQEDDAVIELGEVLFTNDLAKNAKDGCPICLREFNAELAKSYTICLPCGEHALCANCTCSLKIQADKAKQCPQCPLCRYAFDPDFIESIPSQLIEKDQEIANLILNMPTMGLDEKIDITERLFWTHRFEQSKVVDAIEALLDSKIGGLFFRQEGELTSEQKNDIYCKARLPVEKLETKLKLLLQEQSITVDQTALLTLSNDVRQARKELAAAREKARDDIYSQMNSVSGMGAEQEGRDGTSIRVDFHGLLVNEMRMKFNDQIMPILPVVKRVMIITGRGSHSAGKEAKLKKALFKLVSMYQSSVYWQPVDRNPGALYVVWRDDE